MTLEGRPRRRFSVVPNTPEVPQPQRSGHVPDLNEVRAARDREEIQRDEEKVRQRIVRLMQGLTFGLPPEQASVVWSAATGIPDDETAKTMGISEQRLEELQTAASENMANRLGKKY